MMTIDSPLSAVGPNEDFKGIERLRDGLRHLKKRWNNRLVLENCPLWEGYVNGKFEIAIYGEAFDWGTDKFNWMVRIPANGKLADGVAANDNVVCCDLRNPDNGDEIVMFVVIAQTGSGPKMKIRIPARFYFFRDEVRSVSEGLLYRTEVFGGFKVFPFRRKREVQFAPGSDTQGRRVDPMVQAFPEIVHSIARDCSKVLRDRFFGGVVEEITIGLSEDCYAPMRHPKVVKALGQSGLICDNLINVAVGPFDL